LPASLPELPDRPVPFIAKEAPPPPVPIKANARPQLARALAAACHWRRRPSSTVEPSPRFPIVQSESTPTFLNSHWSSLAHPQCPGPAERRPYPPPPPISAGEIRPAWEPR